MKAVGAAAILAPLVRGDGEPTLQEEGPDSPRICLEIGGGSLAAGMPDDAGMRRVKQLGVNHVLMGGPPIPWSESQIRSLMDRLKSGRVTLGNLMISGFTNAIYGRVSKHCLWETRARRGN